MPLLVLRAAFDEGVTPTRALYLSVAPWCAAPLHMLLNTNGDGKDRKRLK